MGGKKVVIGSFVHIGCFTSIVGGGEFVMEDFSGLSGGVRIYTGTEDFSGTCMTNPTVPYPYRKPIRAYVHIKKHAIIGTNTVIMPGVTIGEGAAIGANSFVIRDCKPWTVYLGSPVRRLWERPKERILELETQLRKELYDTNGRIKNRQTDINILKAVLDQHWVTIIDRVSVGKGSYIGAGAVVTRDIPENVLAVGVPAKPIRKLTESDWKELI